MKRKLAMKQVMSLIRSNRVIIRGVPTILHGQKEILLWLQQLGYNTNRNTLKWVIGQLHRQYAYDNIYLKANTGYRTVYISKCLTDILSVYILFRLGRKQVEALESSHRILGYVCKSFTLPIEDIG